MKALRMVIRREWHRMTSRRLYLGVCVVLPLFCLFFMATIFGNGQMENIPVGIVDLDNTATSRNISRRISAAPHLPCDGALHRRSRRPPGIATEGHIRLPRHPAPLRTEGGDGNWRNAHLLLPLCPSFGRQRADGSVREYACPRGALAHRDAGRSSGSQRRTDTDFSAPRRSQYPSPLQPGHGLLHLPEPAFLFRTVPDTHPAHHRLLHRRRTEVRQCRRMAEDGTGQYPHCRSRETAALYPHLLVHRYPGKLCTVRPATYPLRWQSVADECSDRALHHRYPGIGGLYLFCLSQDCLYHQCSIHGGVVGGLRCPESRFPLQPCMRPCMRPPTSSPCGTSRRRHKP